MEISLQKLSWIDFVSKICLVDVFVLNLFGIIFSKFFWQIFLFTIFDKRYLLVYLVAFFFFELFSGNIS